MGGPNKSGHDGALDVDAPYPSTRHGGNRRVFGAL
jgi:hypothetical protein